MSTAPPSGTPGFWTADRVTDALDGGGHADMNLPRGPQAFGRVWTDTRSVGPGDLFVALVGDRFDGHDFVRDAISRGAAGVVIARDMAGLGVPVFRVADTLAALGTLGAFRRRVWGKPVIAVAGSNGKTSTKELIRAALGSRLEVFATTGNLNNLVGVPLTLLALPDHADVAVVEMGTNQPGEVARLRAIVNPDVTVITSVAEEHLEGLGDLAGVLREEASACVGVPVAIVPASQPEIGAAVRPLAQRVVSAGIDDGDVHADGAGKDGTLTVGGVLVPVPLNGAHNRRNAMLALAVAREFSIAVSDAAAGIAAMPAPSMRSAVEQLGRATLINDAYNANPGSTRAALELLAQTGAGRQRVAILGSMLELGPQADRLHDELLRTALESGADLVVAVAEYARAAARAGAQPRVVEVREPDAAWEAVAARVAPDAVILLKGSRGVRLERLVPAITAWARQT
jgi:UDP-N-acetylmuramoyl-tripeptide--D-alanyl-D-alanine ligase